MIAYDQQTKPQRPQKASAEKCGGEITEWFFCILCEILCDLCG